MAGTAFLSGGRVASAASPVQVCVGAGCVPDTQVHYVHWTSISPSTGTASGTITLPGGHVVTLTFVAKNPNGTNGTFLGGQNSCGINYWNPSTPYISAEVPNAPPNCEILQLVGGDNQTYRITFSEPIQDPVMAIVSLGSINNYTTYDFDAPFTIVSQGVGYWGGGPNNLQQLPGNVLQGNEGHGTIRFLGTFPTFSWTVPTPENWHGFTFGIRTTAQLAGQVTVDEGQTATNTGNWSGDPTTTTLSASAGTVVQNADGTWAWHLDTTDGPAQSQLVTITATDGAQTASTDFPLVVNNVAPTATLGNDGPGLVGAPVTVSFTNPVDPSTVDLAAGLHYAFACDGSSLAAATYASSGTSASTQCTYATAGTQTVTGRVIDKDGGFTDYQTSFAVARYAVCTPKADDGHGNTADASRNSKESRDTRTASGDKGNNESGRTIPVKISLCDANGVNVSSRSIQVTAIGLSPTGTLNDSGHANPGNVFRYVDHGYLFNLSTKGLAPGDYTLDFTVAGDPTVHHYAFTIRADQADHGASGDHGPSGSSGHGGGH